VQILIAYESTSLSREVLFKGGCVREGLGGALPPDDAMARVLEQNLTANWMVRYLDHYTHDVQDAGKQSQ
jgi:hypothetical protein